MCLIFHFLAENLLFLCLKHVIIARYLQLHASNFIGQISHITHKKVISLQQMDQIQ